MSKNYSLNHFRKKRFVKILSLLLIQAFLFYNTGFATVDRISPSSSQNHPVSTKDICISRDMGTIKDVYDGEDGKLVIHIQDAHCNYEAQTNIARILEHLIKEYNVNFVAVEGADGIVDTSWFRAFPDADIRKEVADYFMKKGEITGTEFLSITSDYTFTIYGAEDRNYYIKNLNSFLESYPYKQEFVKYYNDLKVVLAKLKKLIYSKELLSLDRKMIQQKEKEIKFADYVKYLRNVAKSKGVDIKKYENFKILAEVLRFEKDIDFDVVNEERSQLIDELSKKLSKKELSELVNESLAFKLGKVDTNSFYSYLGKLARDNKISLSKKYNNLARYIVYSRIYGRMDNEDLFNEIDLLTAALKDKMFVNEDQRKLDTLWKNLNIILGFINIELTNKEYEYYFAYKDDFAPEKFTSFINKNSTRFGLNYNIGETPSELSYIFPKLTEFYEIALKRDKILVKNMFRGMRGKRADVGVLVTGGFHTKGISRLLEEKGVSYVTVCPVITKEAQSPYISVLTGQKTPFEELLVETSEKGGLQFANRICGLCMDPRITGDDLNEAGQNFLEEFATLLVQAYAQEFPDKDKASLRDTVIQRFRECSRRCPNRNGSRHILRYLEENFDTIYDTIKAGPARFGDVDRFAGEERYAYTTEEAAALRRGAEKDIVSARPTYRAGLGSLGEGREARTIDDIFRRAATEAGIENLNMRHNVDYALMSRNGVPTCQIFSTGGNQLVVEVHGEFDRDFGDIAANNLEFDYLYTKSDGTQITRRVNVAQSLAFKIALHEMWWQGRKTGHAAVRDGGELVIDQAEEGKSEAARFVDDATLLWYLASYKAKEETTRQNPALLASYMRTIIGSNLGRSVLPRLAADPELAEKAIGLALAINNYYYGREGGVATRPSAQFARRSLFTESPDRRLAALEIPLDEIDSTMDVNELIKKYCNTRSLSDIHELTSHPDSTIKYAAIEAEKRVTLARKIALGSEEKIACIYKRMDLRGDADKDLPYDVVRDVALGMLRVVRGKIKEKTGADCPHPVIALGNDVRESSPRIRRAIEDTLRANGAKIVYIGANEAGVSADAPTYTTTPMMLWAQHAYSTPTEPIHATIMITGSHLLSQYNGLKFTVMGEDLVEADLEEGLIRAREKNFFDDQIPAVEALPAGESYEEKPGRKDYKEMLRADLADIADLLEGKKIIVDAGNGVGGFYLDVLSSLGINAVPLKVHGIDLCEPDSNFPVHEPNPTVAENRKDLVKAMREDEEADLGITFDCDCDRVVFIDKEGNVLDGQKLLQILAETEIATRTEKVSGQVQGIVVNNKASMAVLDRVKELGARPLMANTGYVYVRNAALETDGTEDPETHETLNVCLAGEESGHVMFKRNNFIDDGMYTANQVLRAVFAYKKKSLHEVAAELEDYIIFETRNNMIRDNERNDRNKVEIPSKIAAVERGRPAETIVTWDDPRAGVRLSFIAEGNVQSWVLLRASLTDPVMSGMVEGKTLPDALQCCSTACRILINDYQDEIDPRRIIAFKQGLEIGGTLLKINDGVSGQAKKMNKIMRGIFAPMNEKGLRLTERDRTPDPLLVAYRMSAVRQVLRNAKASEVKLDIYFESLINQYIAFMKHKMVGINWGSKTEMDRNPDLKKAKGMLISEIQDAEDYIGHVKVEQERERIRVALNTLYGNDIVVAEIRAHNGDIDKAIESLLLGDEEAKVGDTDSLRAYVNAVVGKDILYGQRMTQSDDPGERKIQEEKQKDLALRFLKTVSVKLASELNKKIADVNYVTFESTFNKNFGVLISSLGGGYGSRYSPTQLAHKAYGTPYFTGATNALITLGYGAAVGETDGYQYTRTVSQSDFSVFTFLSPSMKRRLRLGTLRFGPEKNQTPEIRPPRKPMNTVIAPEDRFFADDERDSYPMGTAHVGQNVYGYGGGFTGQVELMVRLQSEGKLPDVPYFMRFDQEHCTSNDETTADVTLVTWMTAVADDNTITVGLKESSEIADKGSPKDISLLGGVVRHLQDFRNASAADVKRKCLALLIDPQTGLAKPGTEHLVERIERGELQNIKDTDDTTAGQLIDEIHHDIDPAQRNNLPINANVTVAHRRLAETVDNTKKNFIQMQDDHPDLMGQRDDRKGLPEYTPNDTMVVIFDYYADNKPGVKPPVGCVVVPKGPDHIKTGWKQSEFNRLWQQGLQDILRRNGLNTRSLVCFTVHPGENQAHMQFNLPEIERKLFGEGGVFVNRSTGEINRKVMLRGKIHVDLTCNIGNDATLNNSQLYGRTYVEDGCEIRDSVIESGDYRTVGKGAKILSCILRDDEDILENKILKNEARIPDGALKERRERERRVLDYIYGRSASERLVPDELMEVLAGEVMSSIESVLIQEGKKGTEILQDIQRLRQNALSLRDAKEDATIDVERGGDAQYVIRQVIANVGLFIDLWDEDPAIVGQVYTNPMKPENLQMIAYREGEISEATQEVVKEVVSIFGKKMYVLKRKQNLRYIDNIIVRRFKVQNQFTRIGNGTYLDILQSRGRFYQGDGWGVTSLRSPHRNSIVILGDHLMGLDDRNPIKARVTAYEPPKRGDINSLTQIRRCTFGTKAHAVRAFIGVGAGEWRDEYRGRVIEDVNFTAPFVIIPEGTEIKKGSTLTGIGEAERKLTETFRDPETSFDEAYRTMQSVLMQGIDMISEVDRSVARENLGNVTRVATVLSLLVLSGNNAERERATRLLKTLEKDKEERDPQTGRKTANAERADRYYEALINKLYVITQIVDPRIVFNGWLVAEGLSPRAPPAKNPNYASLKRAVQADIENFEMLHQLVNDTETIELEITPQLMVVQRPNLPGTDQKSKVYQNEMVPLSSQEDAFQLGMAIQRHSVVKDPEDLYLILDAYRAYVRMKRDLSGQEEKPEHRTMFDAIKRKIQARLGLEREVTDETVVSLYVAVFGPQNYIGIRDDREFRFACFRGGRGARAFLDAMRNQLGLMNIKGDRLNMTMLPGATDDGRSWLLCSLVFASPGMPDIGKCLMDLAQDRGLASILGDTRFDNIVLLEQFNKTFSGRGDLGPALDLLRYGHGNRERTVKANAINRFVNIFNQELKKQTREMDGKTAKEIIIHTLVELREGILSEDIGEPIKAWEDFVSNIWKYLESEAQKNPAFKNELDALEPVRKALLEGYEMTPFDRAPLLERKLNNAFEGLLTENKKQVVRQFLYAEFCANMQIPGYGIPLRSMALVGAHIHFEGAIKSYQSGLRLSIPGEPEALQLISDEKERELLDKLAEMQAKEIPESDIAWYLTIRVMEEFLNTQGSVKPATLRRYHLSGFTCRSIAGKTERQIQILGSEDAYNEVPKIGRHGGVFQRPRPILDMAYKNKLRKAVAAGDEKAVVALLEPGVEIAANEEALEAIEQADLLIMFPTTLVSNITSALLTPGMGEAVAANQTANKLYIHNALLENDPPNTTVATMMEDLFRFLSRQQRYETEGDDEELQWDNISQYFTYIILREPCLYEAYETHYIPTDREVIKRNTGGKVSTVPLDIEDPKMSAKGKYLGPSLIRGVLQLHQLRDLGFRVSDDGKLEQFEGIEAQATSELESIVAAKWNARKNNFAPARFGDEELPEEPRPEEMLNILKSRAREDVREIAKRISEIRQVRNEAMAAGDPEAYRKAYASAASAIKLSQEALARNLQAAGEIAETEITLSDIGLTTEEVRVFAKSLRDFSAADGILALARFGEEELPKELARKPQVTKEELTAMVVNQQNPLEAVRRMFGEYRGEALVMAFIDVSNEVLRRMNDHPSFAPMLDHFYRTALAETRDLDRSQAEYVPALHAIAGQGLNIASWFRKGVPGAENIRLTADDRFMLQSPRSDKAKSYLDRRTMPVPETTKENLPGSHWRGMEAMDKLGENVSETAVYDRAQLEQARVNLWMYLMDHGYREVPPAIRALTERGGITTIHETTFLADMLPGSVQYTSTGPGHFQKTMDIKYVTEGEGIQYSNFYNDKGELVAVFVQYLRPGSWAVSIPGAVDSIENLGGLKFNDVSVEVPDATVQSMLDSVNERAGLRGERRLNYAKMKAVSDTTIKEASKQVPYYVVNIEGTPVLVRNVSNAPDVTWINGIPSGVFGDRTLDELYPELTESGLRGITTQTAEAFTSPAALSSEQPVKVTDYIEPAYIESIARLNRIIQEGKPVSMIPYFKLGIDGYTWGEQITQQAPAAQAPAAQAPTAQAPTAQAPVPGVTDSSILKLMGATTVDQAVAIIMTNLRADQRDAYGEEYLKLAGPKSEFESWLASEKKIHDTSSLLLSQLREFQKEYLRIARAARAAFEAWLPEAIASDVTAERWFASGAIDLGTGYNLTPAALSVFADRVYGNDHVARFGRENAMTAKQLTAGRLLSLQIHTFPEMFIPLEDGYIYMGFKEGITEEDFIDALTEGTHVKELLNRIEIKKGRPIVVPPGMPHGYGAVRIYEIKAVTSAQDRAGTISFFDRLRLNAEEQAEVARILSENTPKEAARILIERKLVRPRKDFATMVDEETGEIDEQKIGSITQTVKKSGGLEGINPNEFAFVPFAASEEARGKATTCDVIGLTRDFVGLRYTIQFEDTVPCDAHATGLYQMLFVAQGKVRIHTTKHVIGDDGTESVVEEDYDLGQGEELPIYASQCDEYTIKAVDVPEGEPAIVYTQYKPLRPEATVIMAYEAIKANMPAIASNKVRLVAENRIFNKGDVKTPGSVGYERKILGHVSGGAVTLSGWANINRLVELTDKTPKDVTDVIEVTKATFERIKEIVARNERHADKLKKLLNSKRIIVLPNLPEDKTRGLPFIREIESAGVILGNTTREDIEQRTPIAGWLMNIMSELTGNTELTWAQLNSLVAAESDDPEAIDKRWNVLIRRLLITMPLRAYDADAEMRYKREALWAA